MQGRRQRGLTSSSARISIGLPASESRRQVTCSPSSQVIFTETPLAQTMRPSARSSVRRMRPPIFSAGRPAAAVVVLLASHDVFPSQLVVRPGAAVVAAPDRSGQLPQLLEALQGYSERNWIFFALLSAGRAARPARQKTRPTVPSPLRRVGQQLWIPERRGRESPQCICVGLSPRVQGGRIKTCEPVFPEGRSMGLGGGFVA